MFCSNDIHRILAAAAPIALVCAAAIPRAPEARAPGSTPVAANQDPVSPWIETSALIGRVVVTVGDAGDPTRPPAVGKIADLIVDTGNFTLPFLVVDVEAGPRTAIAWHAARWDAATQTFAVGMSLEELRSRAEIEPDHLDRLVDPAAGEVDIGAEDETAAADAAAATPLPRLVLASRIPGHAATARDGSAFGRVQRVLVDPVRGDVPAMVLAVETRLHVVPAALASLVRTGEESLAVRFARDADTLRTTPHLDPEDVGLGDPKLRARVFRSVGLTPRPEPGTAAPRR